MGPRVTASGARSPSQPSKQAPIRSPPTYFNDCKALHCGSAAASARAPSTPTLLDCKLWWGVGVMGPRVTASGARPEQGQHPNPPNRDRCGHSHVPECLQGRAPRQDGRQCASALHTDAVYVKTVVRVAVIGPCATASGARPPSQPPQTRTHATTPTYLSVCRAVHCGSAAASALAPSAPMLLM